MAYLIESDSGTWEVVIGLEVHAQVSSRAKLFSGSPTDFGAKPNTRVSLVDAAMPGMLCRACCRSSTKYAWNRRCGRVWA